MTLYEGFFLFDSAEANRNYASLTEEVETFIKKHGGEILRSDKWGERKLAYEIKGVKRGTYVIYYFHLDSLKVAELRRDFQLWDRLLRHMIVREERTQEEIMALETIVDTSTGDSGRPDGDRRDRGERGDYRRRDRDSYGDSEEKPKKEKEVVSEADETGESDAEVEDSDDSKEEETEEKVSSS